MDKTEEKTGKWYNIYVVKCNQSESNAIKQTIVYTLCTTQGQVNLR